MKNVLSLGHKNASMIKKIYVLIPAYKARKTLPLLFKRVPKNIYNSVECFVIVEDCNEGDTASVDNALIDKYSKIHVLHHNENKGYAQSQKTGYEYCLKQGADVCVLLHADGQYSPEEMEKLYGPIINDTADVVLGSRMKNWRNALRGGMPYYKFVANIILTRLENLFFRMNLSEYHSGYMIYSKKALEIIPYAKLSDTFHFDGEMLLMAGKCNLRILDIEISTHYGNEVSHLRPIRYGVNVLKVVVKNFFGHYDKILKSR